MAVRALFFGDTPHRLAGAQRSLLAALGRIGDFDVTPLVVFPAGGRCVDAYQAAGVTTRILPGPPALTTFDKRLLALRPAQRASVLVREMVPWTATLARFIAAERIDVVHFNTPRGIIEGGVAARLARRPAVLHLRGAPAGFGSGFWLAAQLLATRIVLVARSLEQDVAGPFRRRCDVVYNGVEVPALPDRDAARRAIVARLRLVALPDSTPLFVSLSSFTPFKGLHHLLTAAAMLRDRGVEAHFVLAGGGGDPAYEEFLRRQFAALDLHSVTMCGFVPDPLSLLAAADAMVLPSVHRESLTLEHGTTIEVHGTEGLPRSILEAMSLALPVVATGVQGVSEQLDDGVTGLIVPPSDPVALADALARAAADTGWRLAAGRRARAIVSERFTIAGAARGLAEVLHGVC